MPSSRNCRVTRRHKDFICIATRYEGRPPVLWVAGDCFLERLGPVHFFDERVEKQTDNKAQGCFWQSK